MVRLDVPQWGQAKDNYCVPTCIKMVLEYLRAKYGDSIPRFSIRTIARVVETNIDGTAPKKVEKVNSLLNRAVPSVEFRTQFMGNFPEILAELREERPVIVWINCAEPPDKVWHAVVVMGFEESTNTVYYNDPWDRSEKSIEVGVFIHRWGTEARLVKILIGKVHQRCIHEWTTETTIGEPEDEQRT